MAIKLNTSLRNAILDGMITYGLGDGAAGASSAVLLIYTGTVPATGDTAASGTLLVTIDFATNGGWNGPAAGSATLIGSGTGVAVATGTAGYGKLMNAGTTNWVYGSVGTTGTDFIISGTAITSGATITCTQCTISQPAT